MGRRRYPKYDWSGIAMLTQQLGQMFEPSKARLMSQQQDHEMRMLEAKQAWEFGEEQLKESKDLYDTTLKDIEATKEKLAVYGADVMKASMDNFAAPDAASKIHEDVDIRKLTDLNDLAGVYHDKYLNLNKRLNEMKGMNTHAQFGKAWSDSLEADPGETREGVKGKDYKGLHDADKSGTLSWGEQDNALKDYIRDYYAVPEGQEGTEITIGGETLTATPEAQAFVAGFRHIRGRKGVDATDAAAQVSKLKTPDQYLNTMYQARKTIEGYEGRGMSKRQLSLRKGSPYGEFTSADVDIYTSSHDLFKEAYKAYIKKGEKIPEDLIGVAPVTDNMFYNDPDAWFFDSPKEYTKEGLTPEVYDEIQNSTQPGSEIYQQIAFNIVYNWEDIMKHGEEQQKQNMLTSLERLKKAYDF